MRLSTRPAAASKPVASWPRIREFKNGHFVIKGRCLCAVRFRLIRKACYWGLKTLGYILFAAAALYPVLVFFQQYPFFQQGPFGWITEGLSGIRSLTRLVFIEHLPALGRAIYYTGKSPFDFHLFIASMLVIGPARPLSIGVAFVVAVITWPVSSCRIKLTVTPDTVCVHRWQGRVVLPRTTETISRITFRTLDLESLKPMLVKFLQKVTPISDDKQARDQNKAAVAMHGLRSHFIACPLFGRRADQIVAVSHHVFTRTNRHSMFPD